MTEAVEVSAVRPAASEKEMLLEMQLNMLHAASTVMMCDRDRLLAKIDRLEKELEVARTRIDQLSGNNNFDEEITALFIRPLI